MSLTTVRISIETTVGAHRTPATVVLRAQQRGIQVVHRHDGGWFTRRHVITLTGDEQKTEEFTRAARATLRQIPGWRVDAPQ